MINLKYTLIILSTTRPRNLCLCLCCLKPCICLKKDHTNLVQSVFLLLDSILEQKIDDQQNFYWKF